MKRIIKLSVVMLCLVSLRAVAQDAKDNSADMLSPFREIFPEYPGGLQNYIDKNLVYPPEAAKRKKEGKVVVQFIVERDGSVSTISVVRSSNKVFNEEALRLIRNMEKWKPAYQNEKAVRLKYTLPIKFKL